MNIYGLFVVMIAVLLGTVPESARAECAQELNSGSVPIFHEKCKLSDKDARDIKTVIATWTKMEVVCPLDTKPYAKYAKKQWQMSCSAERKPKPEGRYLKFCKNAKSIQTSGYMFRGRRDGLWQTYDCDSQLIRNISLMREGKREGTSIAFDQDGAVQQVDEYTGGRPTNLWKTNK